MGKNTEITCPNCGAPVEKSGGSICVCPYCGSCIKTLDEKTEKETKGEDAERIITFGITEQEAREKLAWELAKCSQVPVDLFENLSIEVSKQYIPLWVFKGNYKAPWSCLKVVPNPNYHPYHNPTKKADYYPVSGVAVGKFNIAVSATTSSKLFFPDGITPYSETNNFKKTGDGTAVFRMNVSKDNAWNSDKVNKHIKRMAWDEIERQTPSAYEEGNSHINYTYTKCYSVLYPIINLTYRYKDKGYSCKMDGNDGDFRNFNHPKEKVKSQISEDSLRVDIKAPISLSKFGCWCFGLFVIGGMLGICAIAKHSVILIALCLLLMLMSIVWGFKMSNKQDEEYKEKENLRKAQNKIKGKFQQQQYFSRMQELAQLNCPLLESHKEEMNKSSKELSQYQSQLQEKAKGFNALILQDEFLMVKYYIALFSLLGVIIISLIIF